MQNFSYTAVWQKLKDLGLGHLSDDFKKATAEVIANLKHGDVPGWIKAYEQLPTIKVEHTSLDADAVSAQGLVNRPDHAQLKQALSDLHPWRKGPFDLFGIYIDSEWQSFMKWNRLKSQIPKLTGKRVLDIGCGNGYYLMRMAAEQPSLLLGIEPGILQNIQFYSIEKYVKSGAYILPLKIEQMPQKMKCFDVVFSMGVLYHRKSPIDHLEHMLSMLAVDGTLVLETLVVPGDEQQCLVPQGRYGQMRNVWFLPSVAMLELWLKRVGFKEVQCLDCSHTSIKEQRSTAWMNYHSLSDFLNPNTGKTLEGYEPPLRALIQAKI